jgi:hypothetical protein
VVEGWKAFVAFVASGHSTEHATGERRGIVRLWRSCFLGETRVVVASAAARVIGETHVDGAP